jgi:dolichol-phosphate mannosyltransferase
VAFGVGLGIAGLFPVVFEVEPALRSAAQLLIVVLAVDLALSIPADTFGGTLVGLQRFDLLNLTLLGISSAQAVAWAVVLGMGGGLVALGVMTTGIGLAGHVARFLLVRRLLPELSLARRNFQRSLVRPFARQSVWFALNDIAIIARSRLDTVVVGVIVGVPAAGIYGVGQKLALVVEKLSEPVVRIFFPYSAELNARQDRSGLRAAVTVGTRLTLAIAGPLCLVLALLAEPVLELWVGPSFTAAAPVVVALAAAAAIKSITYTGALAMSGMGQARTPALVLTAEAALNLILSIVLGMRIGLEGVALATLIATVVAEGFLMLPLMCRRLGLSMSGFLWSLGRAHGLPVVLAVGAGRLVGVQPDSLLGLIATGSAVFFAYVGTFFVTGLSPDERQQMRKRLTQRRSSAGPSEPPNGEGGAHEQSKGDHAAPDATADPAVSGTAYSDHVKTLVVLPTYQEVANVAEVLRQIRLAAPTVDVVVVDDNSPDGTADLADTIAAELGHIRVVRRPAKDGLGSAYRSAFQEGLTLGYDVMVEMDADLSHDPCALPDLLAALEDGVDLVVGSRYVPGGVIPDWALHRRKLSRWGNRYAAAVLGLTVADATSGFRAYRSEVLSRIDLSSVRANGYGFQIEMVHRVAQSGGRIVEIPITFTDRVRGTSKMSSRIIGEALLVVTWWGLRDRVRARRRSGPGAS